MSHLNHSDDHEATTFDPDLLTISEVAETLRVSRTTIGRLVRDGELRCLRFRGSRRVPRADLSQFIDRHLEMEQPRHE